MTQYYSFSVQCPHCGKSLMNPYKLIKDKPSIEVIISKEGEGKKGKFRFCSNYGCYMTESDIGFKENDKLDFLCPSCNKSFKTGKKCDVCGHDIISFNLNVGGKVEICSKKGCQNHSITFKDLDCALHSLHDKYSYGG